CWLGRRHGVAHLGWAGPAGGFLTALLFVVVGSVSRHSVPAMVAEAQWIEIIPGARDAPVSGALALYNREQSSRPPRAERGGILFPDWQSQAGTLHRMVWTDLDQWHWENARFPAGLQLTKFETDARLDPPPTARMTFGPEGVLGKVERGPFRDLGDAVLALPERGNFAVRCRGAGGAFAAGVTDRLSGDEYLASGVLSGEQRRRQAVYRALLHRGPQARYPTQPMLLTWASALDLG